MKLCALFATWMLVQTVVAAQWITIKTPDVPLLANGKPNLSAPAPRTADGHPDLSGLWMTTSTTPCPDLIRDGQDCQEKDIPSLQAISLGYGMPGGLPYQPWAAALVKQRTADNSKDDPHSHCLPSNTPRIWTLPHRQKIIQTPRLLVVLNEFSSAYRQIYTDGRALPVDPQPSWNGYSVGRWQGQTLVVETIGLSKNVWLDISGSPISEDARITERLHRVQDELRQIDGALAACGSQMLAAEPQVPVLAQLARAS